MKGNISPLQKALNLWAIILIIWSIYRANFKLPILFDEFIFKPLIFILPVYYYITHIEKKDFLTDIWLKSTKIISDIYIGLFAGGVLLSSAIIANYIKYKKIFFLSNTILMQTIVIALATALVTAVSEEILSRGFILKRLYENSKNIMKSSLVGSILFVFLHLPILLTNIKIIGNLLFIVIGTDLVLSFAISLLFLQRRSLLFPILIHAFYNFFIILLV